MKIFLLGAYGQNNLGDEALLQVFLEQFPDAHFLVNSAQPAVTASQYHVEALHTYLRIPRFARVRALVRADLVVFGGGSLLKEIEGGHVARSLYLLKILVILILSKVLRKPSMMLGVGIGPLKNHFNCLLSRIAANQTNLICVRDVASFNQLRAIGVRKQVHVTADLVFTLAAGSEAAVSERATTELSPRTAQRVVVIPRYSLTVEEQQAIAAACDHLVEHHGAHIVFVPFQTGYEARYDDLPVTLAIQAAMRHGQQSEVCVFGMPREALAAIASADLLLSARLHGLIFAAISSVPMVAMNYEVKVGSFMAEIGQAWASIDLADLRAGQLPALLDQAVARRVETIAALPVAVSALRKRSQVNFTLARAFRSHRTASVGFLSASALLLVSTTIVNAGNYVYNLVLGRWLGPAKFADLSVLVTLMLVVSFMTAALGQVAAKFTAKYVAEQNVAQLGALRQWMGRLGWMGGGLIMVLLTAGSPLLQRFFQTASPWPFVILGLGMPAFFVQGVDRGILQGLTRFRLLAASYQAEMWVRLLGAVLLVAVGLAVNGAVTAIALSFVATWFVARRVRGNFPSGGILPKPERRAILGFAIPVSAALIGQVMINNSDVLIVKHFFDRPSAGHYAALALVGRIVFFATWSISTALFPIVAQRHHEGKSHRSVLSVSLAIVGAVSLLIILATIFFPNSIVRILFGSAYLSISSLLWLYALATSLYAMANVVLTYRLSTGSGGGSMLAMLAGLGQIVGLWLFHHTLREVVLVQIYVMGGLFVAILAWDLWLLQRDKTPADRVSV